MKHLQHTLTSRFWAELTFVLAILTMGAAGLARASSIDGPELSSQGPFAVGMARMRVDVGQVLNLDAIEQPNIQRDIDALLWYPSTGAVAVAETREISRELKNHMWRGLSKPSVMVSNPSTAIPNAPLLASGQLPVVVLSHGLLNWAAAMNYLGEHLASRGYVVLALEHDDERSPEPLRASLYLRPLDQVGAIRALERWNTTSGHLLHGRLDLNRIAIVGYSMGAYGALVTAGARVANDGMAYGYVPGGAMARHANPLKDVDAAARAHVAAVVSIAPFGGQSSIGALKATGLSGVTAPTMIIVGDQDDVSGYADGVRSIWQGLTATRRWILVYENARHNVGLRVDPAPFQEDFRLWTNFEEPVWRRDRIIDINRHFVTAFLDSQMRGQRDSNAFLNPVTVRSNDGTWPEPLGTPATGKFAGAPSSAVNSWAGFQRRWALGLRLEQLSPAAIRP